MQRRTLAGAVGAAAVLLGAALVVPATAQDTTGTTHLVHGIPDTTVDVCVDEAIAQDDLAPGTRTDGVELDAGDHLVEVLASDAADCSDTPLASTTVSITAGTDVDIVAHLDTEGSPLITVFDNNTDMTANGEGRITLRHAADIAAVDATVDDQQHADGTVNGEEATAPYAAGDHVFTIFPDGVTDTPLVEAETIPLAAGTEEVRYLVGADTAPEVLAFTREVGEEPAPTPSEDGPATAGRISGDFREDTAIAISQETFDVAAPVVYIAGRTCSVESPSCGFADALAGKSLQDGPILLNATCGGYSSERDADGDLLYDANAEELQRLQPTEVIALGGEAAVCDEVLEAAVNAVNASDGTS